MAMQPDTAGYLRCFQKSQHSAHVWTDVSGTKWGCVGWQPEEPAAQTGEPVWRVTESRLVSDYPQHLKIHHVVNYEDYSPDRVWHIFGDGASQRLADYLNALTEEKQEAEDSRDGFAADLDACEDKVKRLTEENAGLKAALEDLRDGIEEACSILAPPCSDEGAAAAYAILRSLNPKKEQGTDG